MMCLKAWSAHCSTAAGPMWYTFPDNGSRSRTLDPFEFGCKVNWVTGLLGHHWELPCTAAAHDAAA